MIEIIQKVCDGDIDETHEKVVVTQNNQSDYNSNTDYKHLEFFSFPSAIDQVILNNLQL